MNKACIENDLKVINSLWTKHIRYNIRYLGRTSKYGMCSPDSNNWHHIIQDYFNILVEMGFLVKFQDLLKHEIQQLLLKIDYEMYNRGNQFGRDEGGGSMMKRNLISYHLYMNTLWSSVLQSMPSSVVPDEFYAQLKMNVSELLSDMTALMNKTVK